MWYSRLLIQLWKNMADKFAFSHFLGKSYFGGTVLKFRFKRDIDKSCQWHRTAPSAMPYGTEIFFKTLLSEYSQHNLKKAEMILYIYFSTLFHVRKQREISRCFVFYREYGCLFKRIKHLSTIYAFSSYSSFLFLP